MKIGLVRHFKVDIKKNRFMTAKEYNEYSMDYDTITATINSAVQEADRRGIKGKEITPFLLSKIKELTHGESLTSNIPLVYNNAKLAAQIACELAKL